MTEIEQLTLFDYQFKSNTPKDEMIEKALSRETVFENGKRRIYELASTNPPLKNLAKLLEDEYGVGGIGDQKRAPNYIHSENRNDKGYFFKGTDRDGNLIEIELSWVKAAEVIVRMVKKGVYQI